MKTITYLLILALSIGSFSSKAVTKDVLFNLSLRTFDQDKDENLENISIDIYESGTLIKSIKTGIDGKAYYMFKLNKEYEIIVNENNNYIQKVIKLDTKNIDLENWKFKNSPNFFYDFEVAIKLFKKENCENFSFLKNEPIIYFKYDQHKKDLVDIADNSLTKKIAKERKRECEEIIRFEF